MEGSNVGATDGRKEGKNVKTVGSAVGNVDGPDVGMKGEKEGTLLVGTIDG